MAKVDFLIFPSRQDNLPNVIIESLSNFKPVLAFNIGGLGDLIKHKKNGYLAKPFDIKDFNRGLQFIIKNHQLLTKNIKRDNYFNTNFTNKNVCKMYTNFINSIS